MIVTCLVEDRSGPACPGEHGLCFYIESGGRKFLSDCGQTALFCENAERCGVDLAGVSACFLSHGHYDHGGGLAAFARLNPQAEIYVHSAAFGSFWHEKDAGERYIGLALEVRAIPQIKPVSGVTVPFEGVTLFSQAAGSAVNTSGALKEKTADGHFVPDAFDHEQYLIITENDQDYLFVGCAHRGIVPIIKACCALRHRAPAAVFGGFHLTQAAPYTPEQSAAIQEIARSLSAYPTVFCTGHCTGEPAIELMRPILGEKLKTLYSGMTVCF